MIIYADCCITLDVCTLFKRSNGTARYKMPATTSKECFHNSVHGRLNMQLGVSSLVFRGQESAAEIGFAGAGPGIKIEFGVRAS